MFGGDNQRRPRRLMMALLAAAVLGGFGSAGGVRAADNPADAYPRVNPMRGQPQAIEDGTRLYFKWCVQCHGRTANGESRFGKYAADLRTFWRGYHEFVVLVLNGRPELQMPPWGGVLDEDEIASIGAYLETLAIEGAYWGPETE